MDLRSRRLLIDAHRLQDLSLRSPLINVQPMGSAQDRFIVTYRCRGLVWLPGCKAPTVSIDHRLDVYLHLDYPRLPPRLRWLTPIFHPNILGPDRNGGVCIGGWSPAETLDQLVLRIGEMVQYRNYSTQDPLDRTAADWAARNAAQLPVDRTPLLPPDPPPAILDLTVNEPFAGGPA